MGRTSTSLVAAGTTTMEEYLDDLRRRHPDVQIGYYQSNIEGKLIDHIQQD